jgi:S1-C subfamily serine protease
MKKIVTFLSIITILVYFLIIKTPIARLGSGFLIKAGVYVFTDYNLVKEAKTIKVRFPNENDIKADVIYKDIKTNLAILKLINTSKIITQPLFFANNDLNLEDETVYTIGYPWTNTMEDKHTLINGKTSLNSKNNLIDISLEITPVNSGGPLLNSKNELVGMVLFKNTKNTLLKKPSINSFIPLSILINGIKTLKTPELSYTKAIDYTQTSQTIPKNNVVLIEAF